MGADERGSEPRFAGFRYVEERRCLRHDDGREVPLRPKTLGTFRHLAANSDRVVGRDSLHREVWNKAFVTDDSLGKCIAEIRHAIGDTTHEVLRTVPRQGYLLTADRPVMRGGDEEGAAMPVAPGPAALVAVGTGVSDRRLWLPLATTLLTALVLAQGQQLLRDPGRSLVVPIETHGPIASGMTASATVVGVAGEAMSTVPASAPGAVSTVRPVDVRASAVRVRDEVVPALPAPRGRVPTLSLRVAEPGDTRERAAVDAVVDAVRATLGGARGATLTEGDSDYRLFVSMRGHAAGGERCLSFELVDARGETVFADAYPIGDAHVSDARAASTAAFWPDLLARLARCAPRGDVPATAEIARAAPQPERRVPTTPFDEAPAPPRRRGRLWV